MTFLAALTTGAAMVLVSAAGDWQSDVGREVTIQVRPAPGATSRRMCAAAVEIARAAPGIADVRAYTKEESATTGRALARHRPVARRSADAAPDRGQARRRRAARFRRAAPGARRAGADRQPRRSSPLDRPHAHHGRHRGCGRHRGARRWCWSSTVLSVTFATRGAMATNRPIVEVLHYVGATDGFIASQFQRHFLVLGFKGGVIGGGGGDRAVRRRRRRPMPGLPERPAATRSRRCSAASPSASPAIWRSSLQIVLMAAGDGVRLAPHRQPHAGEHRLRCAKRDRLAAEMRL